MKTIPQNSVQPSLRSFGAAGKCRVSGLRTATARQASAEMEDTAQSRPASTLNPQPSTLNQLRAFTIVELLVVIAIIGTLAAMLLPVLAKARISAQKNQAKKEMSDIATAIQQYDSVYGRFPVSATAQSAAAANAQIPGGNPDFTYGGVFQLPTAGTTATIGTLVAGTNIPNAEVIAILMDLTNCPNGAATVNANYQKNPQQTIFLSAKMVDTNQSWAGVGQDLVYRDPWGNPYVITLDLNYDELCRDQLYSSNVISGPYNPGYNGLVSPTATATVAGKDDFQYHGKVMVWSAGPDGKIDVTAQSGGQGSANFGYNKDNVLSWQ